MLWWAETECSVKNQSSEIVSYLVNPFISNSGGIPVAQPFLLYGFPDRYPPPHGAKPNISWCASLLLREYEVTQEEEV